MKVLRKKEEWKMEIKCNSCGATLEITREDIMYHKGSPVYMGAKQFSFSPDYFFVICIDCQERNIIQNDDLPYQVREVVREKSRAEVKAE